MNLYLKRPGSSNDETVHILALTFRVICPLLPSRVQNNFVHLEGLKLADDFDGFQDTIDVIVGSNFYRDIVTGDILSGDGPTAISSKLGWLLSGPIKGAKTDNYIVSNLIISGELPMRETDEVPEIMQ